MYLWLDLWHSYKNESVSVFSVSLIVAGICNQILVFFGLWVRYFFCSLPLTANGTLYARCVHNIETFHATLCASDVVLSSVLVTLFKPLSQASMKGNMLFRLDRGCHTVVRYTVRIVKKVSVLMHCTNDNLLKLCVHFLLLLLFFFSSMHKQYAQVMPCFSELLQKKSQKPLQSWSVFLIDFLTESISFHPPFTCMHMSLFVRLKIVEYIFFFFCRVGVAGYIVLPPQKNLLEGAFINAVC